MSSHLNKNEDPIAMNFHVIEKDGCIAHDACEPRQEQEVVF